MRAIFSVILLVVPAALSGAEETFLLKDKQRLVFLGDSNTYSGKFIAYLDAYLCTRFPDKRIELINLGLPSETVSGLSEADHPYPRPNVHERIDRALELSRPHAVVICYGMNDGIYSPFSEDRFTRYKEGITKLIAKVEKAGAKAVLMTPAPFDAQPLKDKVLPKDAKKFSWLRPYERYDDEVLARYSAWLLTLRERKHVVIDAHAAIAKHLETMRKEDPAYRVSGDGIHPNANGHLVVALEILKECKALVALKDIAIDVTQDPATKSDVKLGVVRRNAVTFTFALPLPMPADPAWTPRAKDIERFDERLNATSLKVAGLGGYLAIRVGKAKAGGKRVAISADKVAMGIPLTDLVQLDPGAKAPEVWKLIDAKQRLLGPAWLTHVGHKRPDTPKGVPFAEANKKAAALDDQIRALCQTAEISMGLGPFGK